ncbi:alpha/beta hydrolase [Streptomyces triticagri]|nr:alpha/beta hydrolase [Streptomyces triticagri]
MGSRIRRLLAGGVGVGVLASLTLTSSAMAERVTGPTAGEGGAVQDKAFHDRAAVEVEAPVPELDWTACGTEQCAEAEVPIDYDEPDGSTITLAMRKLPATDPSGRIGTLFVNLGGPGETVTDFSMIVSALGPAVVAKFDLVGVDPRGAGGSAPVGCAPAPGQEPVAKPVAMPPESPEETEAQLAYDDYLRTSCEQTAGPILDHMSIADVARDMDLIRQAVGDDRLSYFGLSYGTLLGQTYAALFPDRVRAMVLDGVLDPVAATTGHEGDQRPVGARRGGPEATDEALASALERCDKAGTPRCPLAGDALQRWQRVHDSLADEPLDLGQFVLDGRQFRGLFTLGAFQYDHLGGAPLPAVELLAHATRVAEVLRFGIGDGDTTLEPPGEPAIDLTASSSVLRERLAGLLGRIVSATPSAEPDAEDVSAGAARQLGALCTDSRNPDDPADWVRAAEESAQQSPLFGPLMVWAYSPCAGWPGSPEDAYHGPFDTALDTPPLLIANTHDGATPVAGAHAAQDLLPGSRLITLDSWGHTAAGKSTCVTALIEPYLLTRSLPDSDKPCDPDHELFGPES